MSDKPTPNESVLAAADLGGSNPIIDDPAVLDQIYSPNEGANHEPEDKLEAHQPWEKAIAEVAEGQKQLQETIAQLAETFSQGFGQRQGVTERVIEREPRDEPKPDTPKWRKALKDDQAELLDEAIGAGVRKGLGEYERNQLSPVLGYLVRANEELLEDKLSRDYPDDTFGYDALKDSVREYRNRLGVQNIDLPTAFKHIAFEVQNVALRKAHAQQLETARKTKEENPMSDTVVGRTRSNDDDTLDAEEMRAARSFFGGPGPDGKPRTQEQIRDLWLANKRGAERDKNPVFDVEQEPEFKRR